MCQNVPQSTLLLWKWSSTLCAKCVSDLADTSAYILQCRWEIHQIGNNPEQHFWLWVTRCNHQPRFNLLLQPIRSTVAFMLTDSRSGGGTPPPAVFEHRVVASMQRHWAFLEQMSGGENGMHTMTTAALFLLTVLSDSLIMMLMLEPWKLWNHHPLRSVVCCAFPSSRLSQTVAKISLDNRMAWNICAQMWAFNSYSGNHLPHWILS